MTFIERRDAIVMTMLNFGLDYPAIGRIMNWKHATVKVYAHYARKRLGWW